MKVDQVRTLLENYSEKDLRAIVLSLYKAMPKRAREDHQIDILLQDPDAWNRARKPAKQAGSLPDPEDLRYEIEQFISDARNQYYFAPNSVIHKSQRPKWRFIVKSYYKDLVLAASVVERARSCRASSRFICSALSGLWGDSLRWLRSFSVRRNFAGRFFPSCSVTEHPISTKAFVHQPGDFPDYRQSPQPIYLVLQPNPDFLQFLNSA